MQFVSLYYIVTKVKINTQTRRKITIKLIYTIATPDTDRFLFHKLY